MDIVHRIFECQVKSMLVYVFGIKYDHVIGYATLPLSISTALNFNKQELDQIFIKFISPNF